MAPVGSSHSVLDPTLSASAGFSQKDLVWKAPGEGLQSLKSARDKEKQVEGGFSFVYVG